MSIGDAFEALEAHLEAAYEFGDEVVLDSGVFSIIDIDKADWAVRKIARIRRQHAECEQVAQAEQERIAFWIDSQRERSRKQTMFLESLLEGYHRRLLDEDPKRKTVPLPSGSLRARKQPDVVEYENAEAFVAWAQEHRADLLRTKVEPDKGEVKKALVPVDGDGYSQLLDPTTKTPVPGVAFRPGVVSFSVVTDDVAPSRHLELVR